MKISQTLDVIISTQRSPYDTIGLGYMGDASYIEDVRAKSPVIPISHRSSLDAKTMPGN